MADETTDLGTVDAQLDALFNPTTLSSDAPALDSGSGTPPKPDKPADGSPPPSAGDTPPPPADDPLAALEAIKDDEPPVAPVAPKTPALTEDQTYVLENIPDKATADKVVEVAGAYINFANAFQGGKFEEVETMLSNWDAVALANFHEHFYQKFVKTGEWVDRYIEEHDGKGKQFKQNTELTKRLTSLEQEIRTRDQRAQQQQQLAQQAQRDKQNADTFRTQVKGLFDTIKLPEGDRRWVAAELNNAIISDPALLKEVKAGNFKNIPKTFKRVTREYLTRDKVAVTDANKKIEGQAEKKPVLPGGGSGPQEQEPLSTDLKKVPTSKIGEWVDKSLDALFSKRK